MIERQEVARRLARLVVLVELIDVDESHSWVEPTSGSLIYCLNGIMLLPIEIANSFNLFTAGH